jgi:hypothetical protein
VRCGLLATLMLTAFLGRSVTVSAQDIAPTDPDESLVLAPKSVDGPTPASKQEAVPVMPGQPIALFPSPADDAIAAVPCCVDCRPPCGPPGRVWVDSEVLLWWMSGARVPPLLTISPPGTPRSAAGVAGPGSTVAFGGQQYNQDLRVGGRITAGMWLNCEQTIGLEAYFFELSSQASGVATGSPNIVGRPFLDAGTGLPNAELVAFPGILNGAVQASASSSGLIGAGFLGRCNLCCGCNYRLDLLAGYRFLYLSDRIGGNENLTATDPTQMSALLGTNILVNDSFATQNSFHGADVGLAGEYRWRNWVLDGKVRIALGATHEVADISGFTTVSPPGFPTVTLPGGLLALSSNSGRHTRDAVAFVPEINARLGYQLTPHVRLYAGYSFLYWNQVIRAGDQIDLAVNPALLPPALAGATPLRPAFTFNGTGLWAQGVDLGLQLRF